MKIIYLHQYFNTPSMAGGTRSYEMARRLVSAGHEVHIVTSWRNNDRKDCNWFVTEEAGVTVHWLPLLYSNHMSYKERINAFFRFAFLSLGKASKLGGDVVFATSTPLTIAIPAIAAARKNKIPMVFEVRDLWPELPIAMNALRNPVLKWGAKQMEKWAYRNSEAVIALSPGMKEGVVAAGYSEARVAVIPNSSDNEEFLYDPVAAAAFRDARDWLKDRPLLVYGGTFGKINGVGYMVELAEQLLNVNEDIRVLLVGDGQEKQAVKELAEELGVLNKNLFIEDSLPKRAMPALLGAADMAVSLFIDLPQMQPNSANKFFDALASGTPVLINYGGWQHDLINARGCGLAMWGKPINAVAKEVAEKIIDKGWLENASDAAQVLAETVFNRDQLAIQLADVITAAVAGNGQLAQGIAPGIYDV